jgi:hypothetical protein
MTDILLNKIETTLGDLISVLTEIASEEGASEAEQSVILSASLEKIINEGSLAQLDRIGTRDRITELKRGN